VLRCLDIFIGLLKKTNDYFLGFALCSFRCFPFTDFAGNSSESENIRATSLASDQLPCRDVFEHSDDFSKAKRNCLPETILRLPELKTGQLMSRSNLSTDLHCRYPSSSARAFVVYDLESSMIPMLSAFPEIERGKHVHGKLAASDHSGG
jgi:hypothetical protein